MGSYYDLQILINSDSMIGLVGRNLLCKQTSVRSFSTTHTVLKAYDQWPFEKVRRIGRRPNYYRGQGGKKSRIPYDKRYPVTGKDVNVTVEGLRRGGNKEFMDLIGQES